MYSYASTTQVIRNCLRIFIGTERVDEFFTVLASAFIAYYIKQLCKPIKDFLIFIPVENIVKCSFSTIAGICSQICLSKTLAI